MIDLRHALPTGLLVGGVFYEVHTDFRVWLEFGRALEEDHVAERSIFKGEAPAGDGWAEAAAEFLQSENATPRNAGGGPRTLDLILDGDYVVGAFRQAYGVDLTVERMHWHVFLALLRSLPDCKLTEIMGYRGFNEKDFDMDPKARLRKLRGQWALPPRRDERIIDWQESAFGKIKMPRQGDGAAEV